MQIASGDKLPLPRLRLPRATPPQEMDAIEEKAKVLANAYLKQKGKKKAE